MAKEMLKQNDIGKKNTKLIASIDDAVFRISHQVNVVLDFVRSTPSSFEPESLKMILGAAIKHTKIPDRIKVSKFSSTSIIQGDFHQLENVFINILSNAIQAIPDTGEIIINVIEKSDFVDIEISDSGHGIPDNVISKIFDPLFTTKQQGTGLGLVSCKTIIENHGGLISVKNNPTTFTVRLPVSN
jgi:signal transduction histidine kinase